MSVWSDMMDRGVGEIQKKEDEVTKKWPWNVMWPELGDVDFPKAMKVQPKTISKDLVDVMKPMSPPMGKLFYW